MSSFLRSFRHWLFRNVSKMITSFALTEVDLIMMTSSNGNIFRVTGHLCGEFTGPRWIPAQRPATRSFDVFFDLRRIKWFNKQSWGWWFETLSFPLWRHCFGLLKWRPFQKNNLPDNNGASQNDNSQYLHWRISSQNDNPYLHWRKYRQNDKTVVSWILNSNAHESPFYNLQMTPTNASHSDWFIDDRKKRKLIAQWFEM